MADDPKSATLEDQTTTQSGNDQADDLNIPGLGDAGKAAIEKERKARAEAEKLAKDAAAELQRLRDAEAKRLADEQKAADDKAVEERRFEELATKRGEELQTVTQERDALAAKVAAFEDRERKRITDGLAEIPDDLKVFDPGESAPLEARLDWFTKAKAEADKRQKTGAITTAARHGQTPRPNGSVGPEVQSLVTKQQAGYR